MNFRSWSQNIRASLAIGTLIAIAVPLLTMSSAEPALAKTSPSASSDGSLILQTDRADVTGDGIPDAIRLIGTPSETNRESYSKLKIVIQDESLRRQTIFHVQHGYDPLLRLCDLNGDGISDLYLTVFDPSDRSMPIYTILTLNGGDQPIFKQPPLPEPLTIQGKLKDNYKAQVSLRQTNQTYVLDLRDRHTAYDQAGYYQNSRLLKPKPLEAQTAFLELLPVDYDKDGFCELRGLQRISGITADDVIAYAASVWKWRYGQWTLMHTELIKQPS